MAGKSNEVDLVVKARNEASSTLKAIVKAFDEFKGVVDTAKVAGDKGNATLGDLARTLLDLNKKAAGLKAVGEVAKNLDEASAAASRLEGTVRESATELAKLAREAEQASTRADRLRGQFEAEQSSLKALTAERGDANKELNQTAKALKDAERNLLSFNSAQERQRRGTKGVGIEAGLPQTSARNSAAAFLAADLENARRASTAAESAIKGLDAEISQARKNIEQLEPAVKAAADQQRRLQGETDKQSSSLRQNKTALADVRGELQQVREISNQVSAATGQQIGDQARVTEAYRKTAEELQRVQNLQTVLSKFSTGAGGFADPKTAGALQKQNAIIREAEGNWKALEAEARRLAGELKTVSGNATQQVNAFNQVIAASRAARAEYNAQIGALGKMQGSARSSFAEWSKAAGGFRTYSGNAQQVVQASNQVSGTLREAARSADGFSRSIVGTTNASRESLSLFQRMRGEIIALTASYVGLVGGAQQLMKVVDATSTLEAATQRLNVAFQGDQNRVAAELAFLGQQADRLGVSFDVLSTQYSRFAVAAKGANFTTENTRDLFLSVAEAGRVNRVSTEQLQGIFKALEQIMSKGKVQAEELRGQLGDRMTGAFQLMADAIGVTTGELDEMLKKGEVVASEENLTAFAARLRQVYGSQVPAALASTTAELGRFENNLFQARLAVGEGGFSEAFVEALRQINEAISSNEGIEFFRGLGAVLGNITTLITKLLPYVDDLALALGILAASRALNFFQGFTARLRESAAEMVRARAGIFTYSANVAAVQGRWNALNATLRSGTSALRLNRVEMATVGTTATATTGRLTVMRGTLTALQSVAGVVAGSFRLMWAAIGGLPGLILTGVTIAVGSWLGRVNDTNTALTEHERILQAVRNAYTEVEGSTKRVADNIKGATEAQALASVQKLTSEFDNLVRKMQQTSRVLFAGFSDFGESSPQIQQFRQIEAALDGVAKGTVSLEELQRILNEIALNPTDEQFKEISLELLSLVNAAEDGGTSLLDLKQAIDEAQAALSAIRGTATEAEEAVINQGEAATKAANANAKAAEQASKFSAAMDEMGKLIPGVAEELERLEKITSLEKLYQDAAQAATNFGELYQATQRYNQGLAAINTQALGGTGLEASASLIRQFEGFRETPYYDVNAFRVGYGSDTVTLADGSVQRVVEGMRVSVEDGNRDLYRRIGEFQTTVRNEIGADRFNAFSREQQAALTSIAYNYGNLTRTGELDTFRNGSVEEIVDAIRRLATQNGGVNEGRRNQEADLFAQGGTSYQLAQQTFELQTKADEATKKRIEDQEFQVQQQELINQGKQREAAIEAAIREAKVENKDLTAEQIAQITELTGREFDLKNIKTEQKDLLAQANAELERAKALYQEQVALQQLLKQQQLAGDTAGVDQTSLRLEDVKLRLAEATENARRFWEQIGGPQAEAKLAAIGKLNANLATASQRTNAFGLTTQQVSGFVDSFASGIANAFGSFAQAVVNGENAFKAFGQAVLQTLAQIIQQIAIAIIRQMILNALTGGASAGGGGGSILGAIAGAVSHGGGRAGSSNRSRSISGGMLASPFVYHTGGVAGLKSDEVVSVLQRGETIRTQEQEAALAEKQANAERASANTGGGFSGTLRNIITLDEDSARNWMTSAKGEQAIMEVLGKNRGKLRGIMS